MFSGFCSGWLDLKFTTRERTQCDGILLTSVAVLTQKAVLNSIVTKAFTRSLALSFLPSLSPLSSQAFIPMDQVHATNTITNTNTNTETQFPLAFAIAMFAGLAVLATARRAATRFVRGRGAGAGFASMSTSKSKSKSPLQHQQQQQREQTNRKPPGRHDYFDAPELLPLKLHRTLSIKNGDLKPNLLIVGDVHGCKAELDRLLEAYRNRFPDLQDDTSLVFAGDLVNKGPHSAGMYGWMYGWMEG